MNSLETCPKCGKEECCNIVAVNETKLTYNCMDCGFSSSDLQIQGEFDSDRYEQELPELYKDLKYIDSENRIWYPMVINVEEKGTVFVNGKSVEDWEWSAIKSIPISEQDKNKKAFKGKSFKSDPSSLKTFGKSGFFEACDYINLFA